MLGERLGQRGDGGGLREQGTDVAAAEGEVSGAQAAGVRCAQGREQKEEADEMAVAETHGVGPGFTQCLYVKRNVEEIGR
jgi:hypothetical protein